MKAVARSVTSRQVNMSRVLPRASSPLCATKSARTVRTAVRPR